MVDGSGRKVGRYRCQCCYKEEGESIGGFSVETPAWNEKPSFAGILSGVRFFAVECSNSCQTVSIISNPTYDPSQARKTALTVAKTSGEEGAWPDDF